MTRIARPIGRRLVLMAFGVSLWIPGLISASEPSDPAMLGFAPASRGKHHEAENRALAVPNPDHARRWLRTLTAEPHAAGTDADRRTAEFVRDRLKDWGWSVEIVPYEVLLNYPGSRPTLQILRPGRAALEIDEKPVASDKDSANSLAFPSFNGYGASGTVEGQVVYVNYARPEDFDAVEKLGVTVKDKIVLARYGGLFRGLKVLNAQKRGARGILIYSDPGDDGYAEGDVYPAGPYRPESSVQRGSVQFLSLGPGDPSTPNGPSTPGADRLPFDRTQGFPLDEKERAAWEQKTGLKRDEYFATIPSLPIGYGAAGEILKQLAGANVPKGWQGGLPLAYHVGPGPVEVQFYVYNEYALRTIWNVVAKLPGAVEPDRWVMLGNHRDAWVYGAADPGSGTAATLETCRALGEAVRAGWKPRRTIVYASWDGEEYGLVGSTEWAEQFADELDRKAALMLNVDVAVSGPDLRMRGVPSLRGLMLESAGAVTDVRSGRSLRDIWLDAKSKAWAASSPLVLDDPFWKRPGDPQSAPHDFRPHLDWLGSGSDYTAFIDHLGVPSLDLGFSGSYGVYHSAYDDFNWMEKFGDPEFLTHATAARLFTVVLMRAAGADVLPFRFLPYAEAFREHVDELRLMHLRKDRRTGKPGASPAKEFEGLDDLADSIVRFGAEARKLDASLDSLATKDGARVEAVEALNGALTRLERAFLIPGGLDGRPWFKHAIYAPGLTTGYASWPLPAIREAIEMNKADKLKGAVDKTIAAIDAATESLKKASALAAEAAKSAPAR